MAAAASKLEEGYDLTPLEHSQLVKRQHMNFRIFENAYYQYRKGTLELPEWGRYNSLIEVLLCEDEPAQTMWTRFHPTFVPEFRDAVEAIRRRCS